MNSTIVPLVRVSTYDIGSLGFFAIAISGMAIMSWNRYLEIINKPSSKRTRAQYLALSFTVISWLYGWVSIILIISNIGNALSCNLTIHICAVLYSATKLSIYLLLIERVFIIQSCLTMQALNFVNRMSNKYYIANHFGLLPYLGALALMFLYNNHGLYGDAEECFVGLQPESAWPLLGYDSVYSLFLSSQFLFPCIKYVVKQRNTGIRSVHQTNCTKDIQSLIVRSLIGASLTLAFSLTNIAHLALNPFVLGTTCLLTCMIDVYANCIVVNYFLLGNNSKSSKTQTTSQEKKKNVSYTGSKTNVRDTAMNTGRQSIASFSTTNTTGRQSVASLPMTRV